MSRHNKQLNILWLCVRLFFFRAPTGTARHPNPREPLSTLSLSRSQSHVCFWNNSQLIITHDEKTISVLIGEYCCPRWTAGEGFRWALRTQAAPLPVIIWHQVADRRSLLTFFFCWYWQWKGKRRRPSLTRMYFFPLCPPPSRDLRAYRRRVEWAVWHWPAVAKTCITQRRHCFPSPSSRPRGRAWHVEQLKHHKCKM